MEYLKLVNKTFGIDESYIPNDLVITDNNENNFHNYVDPTLKPQVRKVVFDHIDIETALIALNIPRLGKISASKLANDTDLCKNIFNDAICGVISDNTYIGIVNLLGVATANSIKENIEKLSNIRYIVDRIMYHTTNSDSKGKIAITGKLSMKRAEFEKLLIAAGYTVGDLSKDTLYLVTDSPNSGSSKNIKADKYGVKKITESEMLALIK